MKLNDCAGNKPTEMLEQLLDALGMQFSLCSSSCSDQPVLQIDVKFDPWRYKSCTTRQRNFVNSRGDMEDPKGKQVN